MSSPTTDIGEINPDGHSETEFKRIVQTPLKNQAEQLSLLDGDIRQQIRMLLECNQELRADLRDESRYRLVAEQTLSLLKDTHPSLRDGIERIEQEAQTIVDDKFTEAIDD